jgi:hippurate hydrolase
MKKLFLLCLLIAPLFIPLPAQLSTLPELSQRIESDYAYLESLYYHLHQNPELSFQEVETSSRLAREMRQSGFEVTEDVGGHGVVAVLKNGPGPILLIRADMDGLPVPEETGLSYASKVRALDDLGNEVSVMHACGHDIHMTVWTGTARLLSGIRDRWKGTLVFIAQPAEERSGGAKAMLADGLFSRFPIPDYALALHVTGGIAAGGVGFRPGFALANVDMVDITVFGKGGHGAIPNEAIDPIVLSSRIILALQTIVSREISPQEPAVVTVGSIHGGTKGNVIPDEVKLELTLRSYSDFVREALIEKIRRICQGEAISAGLPESHFPEITIRDEFTPALYNDPDLTKKVEIAFEKVIGKEKIETVPPSMGGEDFGRYGRTPEKVPIFLYWLGVTNPSLTQSAGKSGVDIPSIHSPRFAPDPEPSIKTGVLTMTAAALDLLAE